MERFENPRWAESQALSLDYNYAMADFVGEHGLQEGELEELAPRLVSLDRDLAAARANGTLGFMELPYQDRVLQEIRRLSKPITDWCWHVVVLGIGGSALGARALHQALSHPQYNLFPMARRQHRPALWVADNIDPDYFHGLLDGLDLRRTAFNVVSKSGSTAETMAQFMWAYQILQNRVGEEKARERLIITTDPEKGPLRELVRREGLSSLVIPPKVGGRFSVLSAVGLLPASLVGINVKELLAGARFMDQRLKKAEPAQNLAYRLASLFFLFATAKKRPILVMMPYAATLAALADWFCQLWAESLGKKLALDGSVVHAGSTPVRAIGATDQHSQLQLYMEGPADKFIAFLQVEKFQHRLEIPDLFGDQQDLGYLAGHSLDQLLDLERQATAFNLMKAGRPSLTLRLPEINPFTMGQLIYLLEVATVAAASLFAVNPLDQPGVEGGKQTTYGLMGRPGFEARRQEFAAAPAPLEKYRVT
jgi:glucose-6-phosphate isomerase